MIKLAGFAFILSTISFGVHAETAPDLHKLLIESEPLLSQVPQINTNAIQNKVSSTPQFGARWAMAGARTFITSLVIVSIEEVRKKLHERNLKPDKESLVNVSGEVAREIVGSHRLAYRTGDALVMFAPGTAVNLGASQVVSGINWVTGRAAQRLNSDFLKAVQSQLGSEILTNAFTSLIAGGFMAFGTNSAENMIRYASRFVVEHPEIFGDLSKEEHLKLVEIQSELGITPFFSGYIYGRAHHQSPEYSAYRKVFQALNYILFHDPILREKISSHIWRETVVNGQNWAILGYGVASTSLSTFILLKEEESGPVGILRRSTISLGVSLAVGIVTAFVPTDWYDSATYYLRTASAIVQNPTELQENMFFRQSIAGLTDSAEDSLRLEKSLLLRRDSRRIRMGYYVSLAKLSFDRIDVLAIEKERIEKQPEQTTFKESVLRFLGGDGGSKSSLLTRYDRLIAKYQNFAKRAGQNILLEYQHDQWWFEKFARSTPPSSIKDKLSQESKNLNIISNYLAYLAAVLNTERSSLEKSVVANNEFRAARRKIDQYSFWGLNEIHLVTQARK